MSNTRFTPFARKPFLIEAVEVTEENIEDLAPLVGELAHKEDGEPYIRVDKKKVPSVFKVFIGFYITKMDDRIRCYSPRIFNDQFVPLSDSEGAKLDIFEVGPED